MASPSGIHLIYRVVSGYFRTKRMAQFQRLFNVTSRTRVLDSGGSEFNWTIAPVKPGLTVMNLGFNRLPPNGTAYVIGDGLCLPFGDDAFDIVYSNSVIEHVGGDQEIQAFADEIRRVGRGYYVQTPNRWFPVEPHYLAPLIHYLPKSRHKKLIRNWSIWGWLNRPSPDEAEQFADSIHLLTLSRMKCLFPDAVIRRERTFGLTKSFIAVSLPSPR